MRAIIIGGTGQLGRAIAHSLHDAGHEVTLASRHIPAYPLTDTWVHLDVDSASDEELAAVLAGHPWVVYALGPDDREHAPKPAADYFRKQLGGRTERVARAAQRAGVEAFVVLGSYFAALATAHPEFAERHDYVAARIDQEQRAIDAGGETMRVCISQIPFAFGPGAGEIPGWQRTFLAITRWMPLYPVASGGTTAVTRATIGESTLAMLERGRHGARYPVGDDDLTWRRMLEVALRQMQPWIQLPPLPRWIGEIATAGLALRLRLAGIGSGLNPRWLMRDLFYGHLYVDHAATRAELGLQKDDVLATIRESLRNNYPPPRERRRTS